MTYIAGAELAAAVANAGALGVIETTSDQGKADLQRVRELTHRYRGCQHRAAVQPGPSGGGSVRSQRHSICDDIGR